MSQKVYTVGTSPVIVAQDRPTRASVSVSMPPTSAVPANTGIIYIGKGFIPTAVVAAPNAGDPITQGTQFSESSQFPNDPSLFKGQLWAISDTAGQQLVVDETFKDPVAV